MSIKYYLKHKQYNEEVVYNFIYQVFEAEKWMSLPLKILEKIIQIEEKEDSEYLYFLLQTRNKALTNLKNWVNINSIGDIQQLRKLIYKELKRKDDASLNVQIISNMHSQYVSFEFENDIRELNNNIFDIHDIYIANYLIRSIANAMIFIDNSKLHKRELFFARDTNNEIIRVFYEGNNLYDNVHPKLFSFKLLKYMEELKIDKNHYSIRNPYFFDKKGKEILHKVDVYYDSLSIKFILNIDDMRIEILAGELSTFAKVLCDILYHTENPKTKKIFIVDIKNKIEFSIDKTGLLIKNYSIEFSEPIDFLSLFQMIFFHYAFYLKIKYNKSLFDILNIKNKDFLKLVGVL